MPDVIPEVSLDFPREWLEFQDPADSAHWIRADLTWLCSRWTCIFGRGCHGTVSGQASTGCCNHGAYFSDRDDEKRTRKFAEQLTREDWQLYDRGHKNGKLRFSEKVEDDEEKRRKTRTYDGACIFAAAHGKCLAGIAAAVARGFEGVLKFAPHEVIQRDTARRDSLGFVIQQSDVGYDAVLRGHEALQ